MHNLPNSSLQQHYLQSILPFSQVAPLKQFIKSKQFYKPQQFIWNNPHRTSKRLYPYYHKHNDNYVKNIKPKIQKLIQNDRTQLQNQRIQKLREVRNDTRRKFLSRKQARQQLQIQTDSRKMSTQPNIQNNYNNQLNDSQLPDQWRQNKCYSQAFGISPKSNTNNISVQNFSIVNKKKTINPLHKNTNHLSLNNYSLQLSTTQLCYNQSIKQYDDCVMKRRQLFTQQMIDKQEQIRLQFKARKKINQATNNINSRVASLGLPNQSNLNVSMKIDNNDRNNRNKINYSTSKVNISETENATNNRARKASQRDVKTQAKQYQSFITK